MELSNYYPISAVKSKGEVFTTKELVQIILPHVPDEVYYDNTKTFLVPGCGTGIFIIESVKKIMSFGYTFEEASSRVFGWDIRVKFINRLKRRGYNVFKKNFLTEEPDMKFDVTLTNPPFHGTNKQIKPYVDFYLQAAKVTKDDGYIPFIIPNAWLSKPDSKIFKPLSELFTKYDLLYSNLDVNGFFTESSIGEDIGWTLLRKSSTENLSTEFENNGKNFELVYTGQKIPKSTSEKIMYSILERVESNSKFDKIKKYFAKGCVDGSTNALKSGKFTKQKTITNILPILYTLNNVYYMEDSEKYTKGKKIFLNHSGHFFSKNEPEKYMPIKTGYIHGQNTYSIEIKNDSQGEIIRHNYSRKLILYYVNKEKGGKGFNTGIVNLPWLGYDKKYSDSDLYEIFELTDDEIKEVELIVK